MAKNYKNISNNSKTYIFFDSEKMMYKLDKVTASGDYYHCTEIGCPCRGKIVKDVFTRTKADIRHNHENNHKSNAEHKMAYNKLKELAVTDRRPVKDLHKKHIQAVSLQTAGKLAYPRVYKTLQ